MLAPLTSGQLESRSAIHGNPRFNLSGKRSGGAVWQRGIVSLVSDVLFADRSGLIEISEARTTFGENLRRQLDRVCAQIGVNGLAVKVAGEFYFQPGFF
jgi:hypothetical protein